jgi:hypothetical protein
VIGQSSERAAPLISIEGQAVQEQSRRPVTAFDVSDAAHAELRELPRGMKLSYLHRLGPDGARGGLSRSGRDCGKRDRRVQELSSVHAIILKIACVT